MLRCAGTNSGWVAMCGWLALAAVGQATASDWPRFRGPDGSGVSPDSKSPPVEWSDAKNLKWKLALPGPGSSSPILVGDRVYITCWSGYGVDRDRMGEQKDLKRHLICARRDNGKILWSAAVDAVLPEEDYRGMFAEHGYASHTPTSDGERVYAFFGKSGVVAYDLDGKQLWRQSVGTDDDSRSWGSASSPILCDNLLIVPATVESQAIVALDKRDGHVVWRKQADGFNSTWGTPILVDPPGGRKELVMGVPGEVWGFAPDTGKLLWYCEASEENSMCSSLIAHEGVVYGVEGRSGGSFAIRAGGDGDVTASHRLWLGRDRGRISTPVFYDGCLYWISGGIINCVDAKTDQRVYQKRLAAGGADVAEPADGAPAGRDGQSGRGGMAGGRGRGGPGGGGPGGGGPGGGGGRPGRGGMGGGGRGGQDYSSPVIAGDKLYYVSRSGEMYVCALGREFKLLATNHIASDTGSYSATPAVSDGELFIRSSGNLYCVSKKE